jgi:hypothetical protein
MEENNKNKDYESVLLERIEGKIDAIIEGQKITDTKVDLLVEDMDEVKARLTNVESEVREVNTKLDKKANEEVADNHEKRLIKLENAVPVEA